MASEHAVADIRSESFPDYEPAIQDTYIEGYDPVSLAAPHASLNKHATWISMGLILASLHGFGMAVWGGAAMLYGFGAQQHDYAQIMLLIGVVEMVLPLVGGAILLGRGRKDYKAYRKATGRVN